jgi:hypothetical protein
MKAWEEFKMRKEQGKLIEEEVSSNILERNRKYIKQLIAIMRLLVITEIPMRGSNETGSVLKENDTGERELSLKLDNTSGIFVNLVKYTAELNKEFATALKNVPKNASYLSPGIQNEIIEIMKNVLLSEFKDEITNEADVKFFLFKSRHNARCSE